MSQIALNLARKWRSSNFKEIIGQDLVVRILQNSLFKNQFFPVYLFSGQRGCGKTSTARVFASAINCKKLSEFQKNPQSYHLPCLQCDSCIAMTQGRHPDFMEIDAASYTGVDNIRNIIDTSSFLPLLGERKIYLIDEVHMLSKAAFNAFLKILEEPPKFVVFILATTEAQKLPETVRSRCFQLFFNPVKLDTVVAHLEHMCLKESIAYDVAGLEYIAHVSQGSLRDAINLLEQARFADSKVTKTVVLSVLGYLDDTALYQLLSWMLQKNHKDMLVLFQELSKQTISTEYVVKRFVELLYDSIILKYNGEPKYFLDIPAEVKELIGQASMQQLTVYFDQICSLDMALQKTSRKQILFESMLLRLISRDEMGQLTEEKKK
ncbi:MAG TPA: DNA polymerase III subunit gamma/tau [Candidatus Saccharimonadales bacterium]|nr:DNA polymerase III subunit gamma/tau [Candidatus Saccharimonadales bacterium]